MDHVVVAIGDVDSGHWGTVESTRDGLRYHADTLDGCAFLEGFIEEECRTGQDVRDGAPYGWLPDDVLLRRLPFRFNTYVQAYIVEDSRGQQRTSEDIARAAPEFWADPRIKAKMRELKRGEGGL